jgi:hypothetical protein
MCKRILRFGSSHVHGFAGVFCALPSRDQRRPSQGRQMLIRGGGAEARWRSWERSGCCILSHDTARRPTIYLYIFIYNGMGSYCLYIIYNGMGSYSPIAAAASIGVWPPRKRARVTSVRGSGEAPSQSQRAWGGEETSSMDSGASSLFRSLLFWFSNLPNLRNEPD